MPGRPQACGREATAQEAEMATAALQPAITSIWEPAADWRVDRWARHRSIK